MNTPISAASSTPTEHWIRRTLDYGPKERS